jgi:hypothetical protein
MSRHYCLTFFKKPEIHLIEEFRYFIYGEEICPKINKLHWQAYVEFYKPKRLKGTKINLMIIPFTLKRGKVLVTKHEIIVRKIINLLR